MKELEGTRKTTRAPICGHRQTRGWAGGQEPSPPARRGQVRPSCPPLDAAAAVAGPPGKGHALLPEGISPAHKLPVLTLASLVMPPSLGASVSSVKWKGSTCQAGTGANITLEEVPEDQPQSTRLSTWHPCNPYDQQGVGQGPHSFQKASLTPQCTHCPEEGVRWGSALYLIFTWVPTSCVLHRERDPLTATCPPATALYCGRDGHRGYQ